MLRLGPRDRTMKELGDEPFAGSHAIGNLPFVRIAPGPVTGKEPGKDADAGGAEVSRIECERSIAFRDCFPEAIGAEETPGMDRARFRVLRLGRHLLRHRALSAGRREGPCSMLPDDRIVRR